MITRDLYKNGIGQPHRQPRIIQMMPFVPFLPAKGFFWGVKQNPEGRLFMANVFMNEAKLSITNRNIDLAADTIKVALVTAVYVANADDQFIDAGGAADVVDARAAGTTDQTLASKVMGKDLTGDFAYFDANDVTFTAVTAGTAIVAAVIYKDTGTPTTAKIIAYSDIPDVTPNGGDITLQWAAPASGAILKLA